MLGDIFISLSGVLPFLVIIRLAWKISRVERLIIPWWLFLMGWVGFGGHVATIVAEQWQYIPPGPVSIYYSTLSRAIMGLIAAVGMTNICRRIYSQSPIPVYIYLPLIAIGPAIVSASQRAVSHSLITQEPLPTQILYHGFIFWMLLSYSSLLLSRLERRLGVGRGFIPLLSSLLYGLVGFIFLYVASNFLYSIFSLAEYNTWRAVVTPMGVVAGAAMMVSAFKIGVGTVSPKTEKYEFTSSGISEIDREFGGLPYPACILIMGPSGSGKSSLSNKLSVHQLKKGDSIALICLDVSAQSVRAELRKLGLDVEECEENNRLILVEGYLQLSGITPKEKFTTSRDLTDISINISKALSLLRGPRKWIIINSVTHILHESGTPRTLNFLRTTVAKAVSTATGLFVILNHKALTEVDIALIQDLFHGVIETDVIEERGQLIRRLRIISMPGVVSRGVWRRMQS